MPTESIRELKAWVNMLVENFDKDVAHEKKKGYLNPFRDHRLKELATHRRLLHITWNHYRGFDVSHELKALGELGEMSKEHMEKYNTRSSAVPVRSSK